MRHCLRRLYCEPVVKYAQALPELALLVAQQIAAPGDRRPHRLETSGCVTRAAGQQLETMLEASCESFGRKEAAPGGRKLNCKWQTIQPATDRRNCSGIAIGQGKCRVRGPCPVDEQANRAGLRNLARRQRSIRLRQGEGIDGHDMLAGNRQANPACHKNRQSAATGEQVDDQLRGGEKVLKIIENEKELAFAQGFTKKCLRRLISPLFETECLCNRGCDQIGFGYRRQQDVGGIFLEFVCNGQCKACLANPAWSSKGNEPDFRILQQGHHAGDVLLAADEGGTRNWQVGHIESPEKGDRNRVD
jgi:hypothetical protein